MEFEENLCADAQPCVLGQLDSLPPKLINYNAWSPADFYDIPHMVHSNTQLSYRTRLRGFNSRIHCIPQCRHWFWFGYPSNHPSHLYDASNLYTNGAFPLSRVWTPQW